MGAMPTLKQAFVVVCAMLLAHGVAMAGELYYLLPWFDAVMHTFGGLAVGLVALACWHLAVEKVTLRPQVTLSPTVITLLFTLGIVAIIGIVWEWHEFALDALANNLERLPAQPSTFDTMSDFFFDLLGGGLAFLISRRRT